MKFKPCLADPDVWRREATKADGTPYYQYILLYVDDVLCIAEDGDKILHNELGYYFHLKEESVGPPSLYLGAKLSKVKLENGNDAWAMSPSQYCQAAVRNVEEYLKDHGAKLPTRATTPLQPNYRPEIDTSDELDPELASYYQSLVGILRWIVELGRVDICMKHQ